MGIRRKIQTGTKVFNTFGALEIVYLIKKKILRCFSRPETLEFPMTIIPVQDMFNRLSILGIDSTSTEAYRKEFISLTFNTEKHHEKHRTFFFGKEFDFGDELEVLLWMLIRHLRPAQVVESGVAAGRTTRTVLSALKVNNFGQLTSIDITPNVGELVGDELKLNWKKVVLPKLARKTAFKALMVEKNSMSVFIHDSDHSHEWQYFEISTVINCAKEEPIILVDDIDPRTSRLIMKRHSNFLLKLLREGSKVSGILIPVSRLTQK